jgi:phosphatidylinositol 4-kinase
MLSFGDSGPLLMMCYLCNLVYDILIFLVFPLQSRILDLRCIPEALPYFVTPNAVDEDSVLLQQLPHWAACSITQALEFLTPAYKGHPRVMAYVLRVLESYPPERVTFFMPQLVQSLRYDDGVGYLMNLTICAYVNTLVQVWLGKH